MRMRFKCCLNIYERQPNGEEFYFDIFTFTNSSVIFLLKLTHCFILEYKIHECHPVFLQVTPAFFAFHELLYQKEILDVQFEKS
jgi:hypothetical protein